ncbi:MAG: 30S ribosomal protein S17 [Deltaproteobacteria bacterium]|nr:30S ribosomal protein S17 [Deltaproteobacteria bacterium]
MNVRKVKVGVVVSTAMQKTASVMVERLAKDPKYQKYIRRQKKFLAHDEQNSAKVGDRVEIRECRPLSKRKRWRIIQILDRGEAQ